MTVSSRQHLLDEDGGPIGPVGASPDGDAQTAGSRHRNELNHSFTWMAENTVTPPRTSTKDVLETTDSDTDTYLQCGLFLFAVSKQQQNPVKSYLRERSMGPLPLYMFWEPAGLNNKGLWERDEDPDDVLSR